MFYVNKNFIKCTSVSGINLESLSLVRRSQKVWDPQEYDPIAPMQDMLSHLNWKRLKINHWLSLIILWLFVVIDCQPIRAQLMGCHVHSNSLHTWIAVCMDGRTQQAMLCYQILDPGGNVLIWQNIKYI